MKKHTDSTLLTGSPGYRVYYYHWRVNTSKGMLAWAIFVFSDTLSIAWELADVLNVLSKEYF